VEVDRCTACGGIWLDAVEPERLRALAGSEEIDTGDEMVGQRMNELDEEIDCPRCRTALTRRMTAGGIEIDSCPRCLGSYFDAGEFRSFKAVSMEDVLRSLVGGAR
jgi:Zn-finger nucleic acid-binding protein